MYKRLSQEKQFKQIYIFSLIFIYFFANVAAIPFLPAEQVTQWSQPRTIPLYQLGILPPVLVADQNRTVHAFSSQLIDLDNGATLRVIFYNQWSLARGWTLPTDIIISPYKEARITDVHLGSSGIFHLIFFGGDETGADIYYSQVSAPLADDSRVWSTPIVIGKNASDPANAAIVESDQGTLSVVYSGREQGNGLYVVNSKDNGATWSDAAPIYLAQSNTPNLSLLSVIKGESGWLHAVWGVFNVAGQGRGIYYTRSKDGIEWSEPNLLVSAEEGLGTQTPAIIEYDGVVFVFYSGISMLQSFDNGVTWNNPVKIFPRFTGVNGTLSPVIDGNNVLHLFFGQRISGNPDIHGMWHSTFENNRWTEPMAVTKGPRVVDKQGLTGFDPYDAHAVVSQGNVLLVTWRTDPGDIRDNGIWYSYSTVDAPELPLATFPPMIAKNDTTSTPTEISAPSISTKDTGQISFEKDRQVRNPLGWIAIVVIFVSIIMVIYMLSKRNS